MMDVSAERPQPHRSNGSSTSELFICFTSRLSSSSSSMKISSKSILSPGRARDAPISLSASLSRRLRANGSLKGGQSPMFPTGAKKRGCAFENPEPSSPKVTCIGQVRVKTKKKQGKKMRTLSSKRIGGGGGGGEVSFRRVEQSRRDGVIQSHPLNYQANANNIQQQECLPHRNQKWVHLPLTICEALRAFGAEFSCLFPCRSSSSCLSTSDREKDDKATGSNERTGQSSCGAVCAKWLVALQDGEGGKGREIELVVGREEESTETTTERTFRRNVMEEIGIKDEKFEVKDVVEEEEKGRMSICIPPKNALLLMRCRSDPMRMSALANRFWESPAPQFEEEEDDDHAEEEGEEESRGRDEDVKGEVANDGREIMEDKDVEASEKLVSETNDQEEKNPEAETIVVMEVGKAEGREDPEEEKLDSNDQLRDKEEEEEVNQELEVQELPQKEGAEENEFNSSSSEAIIVSLNLEIDDAFFIREREAEPVGERTSPESSSAMSVNSDLAEAEEATLEEAAEGKSTEEKETQETPLKEEGEEETVTHEEKSESEQTQMESEERKEVISHGKVERESEMKQEERERSSALPDCLLLMRCEPKLSMEVSKETWVCSADFIRRLPEKQPKATDGGDKPKKRIRTDSNPALPSHPAHHKPVHQPPRSSCSLPAAVAGVSMATMVEEKLVNAAGNEPLGLTRCKSEPMRTAAAARLAPDTCFWKNRKLEPHRRATIGVGAAGVGF